MAITYKLDKEVTTRAYEITFKSKTEPMSISYTNDLKGFRGSVQADKEKVLEVLTNEELISLKIYLQRLADAFNPDNVPKEVVFFK